MAISDQSATEKKLHSRYILTTQYGVSNLLNDIHTLRVQRFKGTDTTAISNILIDFENVMNRARLTKRQKQALYYHYELDLTQGEVAEQMGITQQAVSKHIDNAIAKIVIVAKEDEARHGSTI